MSKKQPKILFLDIETSLINVNMWRVGYGINVLADQIVKGSHTDIICIGYKWAHEKKVHCPDWGVKKQDSRPVLKEIAAQIAKADVVIGHNGDAFDVKLINTLNIIHKLPPIAWPPTEDTLKMARKHFKFNSNKLDHIARTLLGDKKLHTSMKLCNDVQFKKCPKAMRKMVSYCKKDVLLLEEVFNVLQPYCSNRVNRAILSGNDRYDCPSCGSSHTQKRGIYTNKTGQHQRHQCQDCGHWYKGKKVKK